MAVFPLPFPVFFAMVQIIQHRRTLSADISTAANPKFGELNYKEDTNDLAIGNSAETGWNLVAGNTWHDTINQLVHGIAENSYKEYTYSGTKVTDVIIWTDSGKTVKIREYNITYTGSKVSTYVTKQYDNAGSLLETKTDTYVYSGANVSNITTVMS
jgi:hypothetical protein